MKIRIKPILLLPILFCVLLVAATSAKAQLKQYDFIVAKDGSGNFKTVQESINAVPAMRKQTTTIFIKNGVYKEKLTLPTNKTMVTFIGENAEKTVITYDDYHQKKNQFGEEIGTSGSAGFFVYGNDFSAENITFQNTAGPVGQAVAVWTAGDRMIFKNCRFLGFQDTLYTFGYGSRQYYKNCYIEGTVDFIFGSSTAVFQDCELLCKKNGFVTAASTPDSTKFGYVFLHCKITGNAPDGSYFLGRPWRPFAKVAYLNCDLGKQINPKGWNNWSNESNEKTAQYAEYKSVGPGANAAERVKWAKQLSDEEAKQYTLLNIFRGWKPE